MATRSKNLIDLVNEDWQSTIKSKFVNELLSGQISDGHLGNYLKQDYQFLEVFLKLIGAAITNAPTLDVAIRLSKQLGFIANDEDTYFTDTFKEIGIPENDYLNPLLTAPTASFLDLYEQVWESNSYAKIITLLFAAEKIYLEWAKRFQSEGFAPLSPKHQGWVRVHSGEDFEKWCNFLESEVNDLQIKSDTEESEIVELFSQVTILERKFFEVVYE